MTMPEAPEPQLTEAEVERIAARKPNSYGSMVNLPIAERDALIRDWRAMKAENEQLREHVRDLNHDFESANKHCEEHHEERPF